MVLIGLQYASETSRLAFISWTVRASTERRREASVCADARLDDREVSRTRARGDATDDRVRRLEWRARKRTPPGRMKTVFHLRLRLSLKGRFVKFQNFMAPF
jgi:hypothetical protein